MKNIFLIISFSVFFTIQSFPQWKIQPSGTTANLHSVCFTDAKHGWAVGDSGVILKYDGKKWNRQNSGTNKQLFSVYFTDTLHGWIVGRQGTILNYDGNDWKKQQSPTSTDLLSVHFINKTNGWVVGGSNSLNYANYTILKYINNQWTEQKHGSSFLLSSMGFTNLNQGWMIGSFLFQPGGGGCNVCCWQGSYIFEFNGIDLLEQYQTCQGTIYTGTLITSICTINDNNSWAVAWDGTIFKYNGTKWSQNNKLNISINSVYFTDLNNGWVVGNQGKLYRYNSSNWISQISETTNTLYSVHFIDSLNGWAVGDKGIIIHTAKGGIVEHHTIQGYISYDNIYNTPLKNTKLYLKNNENKIIDSTITDTTGFYKFQNVNNGYYTLSPKPSSLLPWGGVDPVDALMIDRNYIKRYMFTDNLLMRAGDVNIDNKINPIDALLANRRYLKFINSFKAGDWLWDDNTITVDGQDIHFNLKVVCAGDANGSYKF